MTPATLGSRLQHLRQQKRLEVAVAAQRAGISERRLLAIEADDVAPRFLEVVALAEAYNTPIETIEASLRRARAATQGSSTLT